MLLLYIAVGGAAGALARYGLGGWIHNRVGFALPWGTFVVNALGCLLIGFTLRYLEGVRLGPEMRAFIGVGVLGAFTTFSTFSYHAGRLEPLGEQRLVLAARSTGLVEGVVT